MARLILVALLAFAGLTAQFAAFVPHSIFAADAQLRRVRVVEVTANGFVNDQAMPSGNRVFTQPLVFTGLNGFTLRGTRNNQGVTRIIYRGPPAPGVIQFVGCTRCSLIDLEIVDEASCDATVLTTNAVDPPNQGFSTANVFRNVRVLLGSNGKSSKVAFAVDSRAVGGKDANNDHHQFVNCLAQAQSEAGFKIVGSQCHDLIFTGCAALDYGGRKPIGLHAAEGVFFSWRDGAFNSNSIDVLLGTAEVRAVFDGVNSENAQQFLVYPHAHGLPHVSVSNARIDCKPVAGKPVVDVAGGGPWSFRNCFFAGTNGICPTMRFTGTGMGSVDLSGVMIRQHGGTTPLGPVIACPATFDLRQFGLRHQLIDATGRRTDSKIVVNALGVQ